MRNLGNISAPGVTLGGNLPKSSFLTDSAIASGRAALISELEKRDPLLREPLTSVTWPRDIPVATGGGWVDTLSTMYVNYGVSEGSGQGVIAAPGANNSKVIQANLSNERWGAHTFDTTMRIGYIDLQRANITGRSLEQQYQEGIRLTYDKHLDQNVYEGFPIIGTYGLMNNPNVTARTAALGAGGATDWNSKTADEILADVNAAIIAVWAQGEHDLAAIPNHILLPYKQYNLIATTKVSLAADKTILTFILDNNIAKQYGVDLFIGATNWNAGAGTGGTDRMLCYVNKDRFLLVEELVSLHRAMTESNVQTHTYDSLFLAHVSEVEFFYLETIGYIDGI